MSTKMLIVYGTTEGQTEKIARFMAAELKKSLERVDIFNVADIPRGITPESYSGIIVGASVHMGKFQTEIQDWAKRHSESLRKKPAAFFSVCLGVLQNDPKVQMEEREIVAKFFHETGWQPKYWTIFAGAVVYKKYGWLKKSILKRISSAAGGGTDTSRDYEYTNWDEVAQFTQKFGELVQHIDLCKAIPQAVSAFTKNRS